MTTTQERFWAKVQKTEDCWNWTAASSGTGYGVVRIDGTLVRAHRVAYTMSVGPIPEGLQLDHLCRNRACVNPAHLEPVTQAENSRRSPIIGRHKPTHCTRGHEYNEENTRLTRQGSRACRACRRARYAEQKARA